MNTTRQATTAHTRAREYLRVSLDKNEGASCDEQHGDNQRAAETFGFALGVAYRDPNRSASRYATKAREAYDKLIVDLEKDRFDAEILIIWESSRGSRQVGEWVRLIELCEQRRVKIHVTTHGRTYDPVNPRDRRTLLEDAVDSEYESSKISIRSKRSSAMRAQQGKPVGRAPFGYVRIYDQLTKKLIEQKPEPVEAKIIKELFARLAKGHSLRSIAKDFEVRGIRTRTGIVFSAQHLRSLATNRTYNGERVHIAGGRGSRKVDENATIVKGQWKPLVDKRTFLAVQRMLNAPERITMRPGRGVHLLSMIAKCAVCEGPLAARGGDRGPQYQCHRKGCLRIDKPSLDALAEKTMLDYLNRRELRASLADNQANDAELAAVRDELAELQQHLAQTYASAARGTKRGGISAAALAAVEPPILADIAKLDTRERELSTPSVLSGLMSPGANISRWWNAAEMSTKRELARLLLAPNQLGELRVLRSPSRGHRVPAEQRVSWWRTDDSAAVA